MKKYSVVRVYYAGLIGVSSTVSQHSSKAAAFRALHHLERVSRGEDIYYHVEDNETGQYVIESWTYQNGRKVYF